MQKNLFLVGPMGVGKTTIGKLLAKTLNLAFYDSDKEIEKHTGASISLIFELEQESGFRLREQNMIDMLSQKSNIVLATGGGAVLSQINRDHLSSRGVVIYLKSDLENLYLRTNRDKNRPLLQTENPKQKLADILAERDPIYREIAHKIIETDKAPLKTIVNNICESINRDVE